MKRRVKVFRPLEECQSLHTQMLDPDWPHSCAAAYDKEEQDDLLSVLDSLRNVSAERPFGSLECAEGGNMKMDRRYSLPAYCRQDVQKLAQQPLPRQDLTDSNRNIDPPSCKSQPERSFHVLRDKMQNEDSSAKSGCSTASMVDVDDDFADSRGQASFRRICERVMRDEAPEKENDVHAAARRSIELSRKQRDSSSPMPIPAKKHSRRHFFKF